MRLKIAPATLAGPLSLAYQLWIASLRFECEGETEFHAAVRSGRVVLALWHDELFACTAWGLNRRLKLGTVVSQSRDGEIISLVLERLGFATARGSSHRGGVRALKTALRILEAGNVMTLTVDGPRGPRHVAKDGAVYLAAKAGALLVPLRARAQWGHRFESWDRFQLPWPGSRIEVRLGTPWQVPPLKSSADLEAQRARLDAELNRL